LDPSPTQGITPDRPPSRPFLAFQLCALKLGRTEFSAEADAVARAGEIAEALILSARRV
jgi:hypothetical protein